MKKVLIHSFLLLFVVAFAACGGGESTEQAPAEEQAAVDDGVRTINIIGTDDLKFAVEEGGEEGIVTNGTTGEFAILEAIEAAPGEEIRINLRTISAMPPTAMSHNFVLVEMGTDVDAFARESLSARDNDYISPNFEDNIIASTAMLGNGESDTVTFTVPEEPGEYDFICTFPGHYAGGMVGKLIVQ
jgi:azurin